MLQSLIEPGLSSTTGLALHRITVAMLAWIAVDAPTEQRRRAPGPRRA
ncbi:hypothetical protein [Nocardia vinacea]|nr:hypothetical protein [Nocardia vinacea]